MTEEQEVDPGSQCFVSPDGYQSEEAEAPIFEDGVSGLKVFPNPFLEHVNFHFVSETDSRAKLEVFDTFGRLVETVFEGRVTAGNKYEFRFNRPQKVDGMLFYRLTTSQKVYTGKLINGNL